MGTLRKKEGELDDLNRRRDDEGRGNSNELLHKLRQA